MVNRTIDKDFADLEIRILQRQDEGYPVEITLGGEQESRQGYLSAGILPWAASADPVSDGQRLFDALFAESALRDAWMIAQGQSPQRRVRLRIDEDAPELHTLPWELLRDGDTMLSADGRTPFSRYLPVFKRWGGAVEERPIRVLVVISNPHDLETKYNLARLDVETERAILTKAFSELDENEVELTFLAPPVTLEQLETKLHEGYHILHYLGHGAFNKNKQSAALYMQDEQGNTQPVRDEQFSRMLSRQRVRPRLVFLAACQSAARSTMDAFLGLGPKLVTAGAPAIVAMQDKVAITTARKLSQVFYQRLAEHGMVDCAMNEARSVLLTAGRPDAAVPVLFMRLRDGQLWDSETGKKSGTVNPKDAPTKQSSASDQFATTISNRKGPVPVPPKPKLILAIILPVIGVCITTVILVSYITLLFMQAQPTISQTHIDCIITLRDEQQMISSDSTLSLVPGDVVSIEKCTISNQSLSSDNLSFQYFAPAGRIHATSSRALYVAPEQPGPDVISVRITDKTNQHEIFSSLNITVLQEAP